jgi:hypothetical protein
MEIANNPRPCRTITIFENENKLFFKTAINQGNQTFLVFDTLITEYNNISKTFVMNGLKNTYNLFHINNINYLYINDSKYEYLYCNDYNCNSEYTMTPALKAVITENKYNIIELKWYEDPRYNKDLRWIKNEDVINETEFTLTSFKKMVNAGYKPASTWYDDMQDNFLKEISPLLVELVDKKVPDVRVGMRSFRDQILR